MSKPSLRNKPTTAADLSKLTIPQLKALCKENGIKVSSKLNKDAIIQAIVSSNKLTSHLEVDSTPRTVHTGEDVFCSAKESEKLENPLVQRPSNFRTIATSIDTHSESSAEEPPSLASNPKISASAFVGTIVCSPKPPAEKRKADIPCPDNVRMKKSRTGRPSAQLQDANVDGLLTPSCGATSDGIISKKPAAVATIDRDSNEAHSTVVSRRFFPPAIKCVERFSAADRQPSSGISSGSTKGTAHIVSAYYLDFPPVCHVMQLQRISLPVSLLQHELVERLATAFALVPPQDLHQLSQVSRLFRHAVYLSAVKRLDWEFSGRRLTLLERLYDRGVTDFWPYLRERQKERSQHQDRYEQSFLSKAFAGKEIISERLWGSPDHRDQVTIAVRFLLTRCFFNISVGHAIPEKTRITDVQELVKGEIWSVETSTEGRVEVFYVLEATCEVIGHQSHSSGRDKTPYSPVTLRVDWSAYIEQHMSQPSQAASRPSLMEKLKWTNHEEYHQGISKIWLSRTQSEGESGGAKRLVAERYILACLVENSVSGRWMSSTEMAQEFNGLPLKTYSMNQKRHASLHLFLPAHHYVESVHFTTSFQEPLHPALAVIQTPGREYHVLKDNGMQVGCEEDGIAPVWMQILGCDALGRLTVHQQ